MEEKGPWGDMGYQGSHWGSLPWGMGLECWGEVGTSWTLGCVGHMELEAHGPDVNKAAVRVQGPKHPLHTGWQIPSENQRNFPKKMGGVGKTPNLLQSSI